MNKKKINFLALCEGATEKMIVDKLEKLRDQTITCYDLGGDGNLEERLKENIDTVIENAKVDQETATAMLVLVDRDDKEIASRCQKVLAVVKNNFDRNAEFEKTSLDNVFILKTTLENLRLVLHVSSYRCEPASIGYTSDDYVLKLALTQTIASRLLGEDKSKKKEWTITKEKLLLKIQEEMPKLLKDNGIPSLSAKQYLRLYAALVAPKKSVPGFAGTVLEHSDPSEIQTVFESFITAIGYLRSES